MHARQNLIYPPHRQNKTGNSLNSATLGANYKTKYSVDKQELQIQCVKTNISLGREQYIMSRNRDTNDSNSAVEIWAPISRHSGSW